MWEVARVPNPARTVRILQRLRRRRRPFVRPLDEDSTTNAFVPEVLTAPDLTYLRGYWQFEAYFADREAEIRRDFTFPELGEEGKRVAAEIEDRSPAVSVHVRRGDYVGHGHLSHLDATYYADGVRAIAESVGEGTAFVFSDDPQWCSDNLSFPCAMRVVDRPLSAERTWEDMRLMSRVRSPCDREQHVRLVGSVAQPVAGEARRRAEGMGSGNTAHRRPRAEGLDQDLRRPRRVRA